MTTFPLEIWEAILEYNRKDHKAIRSCSLVSRLLLFASRTLIFGHLRLSSSKSVEFVKLLAHEECTIPRKILGITFSGGYIANSGRDTGRETEWIGRCFPSLLEYFGPVKAVNFTLLQMTPTFLSTIISLFCGLNAEQTFLNVIDGFSIGDLCNILRDTSVRKVRIGLALDFDNSDDSFSHIQLERSHLEELYISGRNESVNFVRWAQSQTVFVSSLRTLRVNLNDDRKSSTFLGPISALIKNCGSSLLEMTWAADYSNIPFLDLSHNTQLKKLDLQCKYNRYMTFECLSQIIGAISSQASGAQITMSLRLHSTFLSVVPPTHSASLPLHSFITAQGHGVAPMSNNDLERAFRRLTVEFDDGRKIYVAINEPYSTLDSFRFQA